MGRIPPHPGSFRKSGKQRTYGIRNLEEPTDLGRKEWSSGLGIATPTPWFFVSVDYEGVRDPVSPLK
jgi:hypothetical protein